jgi:flagellar basal-body rod protein FlgF
MLDRLAYVAMTGARQSMGQLATTADNLSNAATPGFREMVSAFRSVPVGGPADGAPTRSFVVDTTPGASFTPGVLKASDDPMEVAVDGRGFLAVVRPDGTEAYTRGGRLAVDAAGRLTSPEGTVVRGDDGPIVVGGNARLDVSADGTVWARRGDNPFGQRLGRIKLVRPDERTLSRGPDGLWQATAGGTLQRDASVRVRQRAVESSNVDVSTSMVQMISQTRMFELNLKLLQTADQNARTANQLLSLPRG